MTISGALERIRPYIMGVRYGRALKLGTKCRFRKHINFLILRGSVLEIGNNVFINNNCSINVRERVSIGDNCLLGENIHIYDHNHIYSSLEIPIAESGFIKAVHIGKGTWIGSNCTILAGVTIGDNCVIGANCLIYDDIPSNSIVKCDMKYHILERRSV